MTNINYLHKIIKENPELIRSLGEGIHTNLAKTGMEETIPNLTLQDCIDYVRQLFDGYIREKSVVNDGLVKYFPDVVFEESPTELDHAGDIDYMGHVGNKAFGIQIKPVTARSNFGNYSPSERMKASFAAFQEQFGGKVFIIFSLDGEIANKEVLKEIELEIAGLHL